MRLNVGGTIEIGSCRSKPQLTFPRTQRFPQCLNYCQSSQQPLTIVVTARDHTEVLRTVEPDHFTTVRSVPASPVKQVAHTHLARLMPNLNTHTTKTEECNPDLPSNTDTQECARTSISKRETPEPVGFYPRADPRNAGIAILPIADGGRDPVIPRRSSNI